MKRGTTVVSASVLVSLIAGAAAAATPPRWSIPKNAGPNGTVNALAVVSPAVGQPERLYVGGDFGAVVGLSGTIATANLASWTGQEWGAGPGVGIAVQDLAVHPYNGVPTMFACGSVGIANGQPVGRLTNGQWVGIPAGTQAWVSGLASFDLGQGARLAFSSSFFIPSAYIAAWNGTGLEAMGGGVITVTKAFATFDEGNGPKLYAGAGPEGVFSMLGRYDGTSWEAVPGAPVSQIHDMVVFDDGSGPALYVAGDFTQVFGCTGCSRIVRYRGGVWSALGAGLNGSVKALAVFNDGSGAALYAAGDFSASGATPLSRIARWRHGQWSALDGGIGTGTGVAGGSVKALAVFDDDGAGPLPPALYAAGEFASVSGMPALRIARWGGAACEADIDDDGSLVGGGASDGAVDINDLLAFLAGFETGSAVVDLDDDGDAAAGTLDGAVDINDLVFFLSRFEAGC